MAIAVAQFTIRDENDITVGVTAPANPVKDQMWLDTSLNPSVLKRYNGSSWDIVNETIVGGRNLLLKTGIKDGTYSLSGNVGTGVACAITVIDETSAPHNKAITLTRTDTTTTSGGRYWNAPTLISGNVYTWSIWLKGTGTWAVGQEQGGSKNITLTSTWTKYTYTFTANSSGYHQFIIYRVSGSTGGELSFHSIKLEKGTMATDWTPAPEDIDSAITAVKSVTETNTTSINAIQGQITTLISNTTITTNGTTTQLKDAYNGTVNTVNSMQTTIGQHTSQINTANGNIASVTSKEAALEITVNSINATLTDTKSTVSTHTTQISGVTTTANAAKSSIDNLQVGGRNLLLNSDFSNSFNNWTNNISTLINSAYLGKNAVYTDCSSVDSSTYKDVTQSIYNIKPNTKYTISLYSTGDVHIYFVEKKVGGTSTTTYTDNGWFTTSSDINTFVKSSHTLTTQPDTTNGVLYIRVHGTKQGKVTIIKFEEGNKATDWTPAPEDVDSSIAAVNTTATTASTNASSAKSTANTASSNASTALTNSNTAVSTANTANGTANTANNNASSAITTANSAISTATTASTNANSALTKANKASTDVATLTTTVSTVTSRVTAVELTTSGLTTRVGDTETKINNLQIGGRNLIKNSTFTIGSNGFDSWRNISGFSIISAESDKPNSKIIKAIASGLSSTSIKSAFSNTFACKKGDILTFSVDVKVDTFENWDIKAPFIVEFNNASGTRIQYQDVYITSMNLTTMVDATWYRVSLVATVTADLVTSGDIRLTLFKNGTIYLREPKVEKGNQATDWTPAPEDIDSSIADVKTYATTTINSNVSTINQTTNAITASVTALQSSVSTIQTTLGNKADTTTVTAISNRTATLETSVTGINASITTLNSNVSTVTTTANSAKSAIDGLQVGGRNLILGSGFSDFTNWTKGTNWVVSAGTYQKNNVMECDRTSLTVSTSSYSDLTQIILYEKLELNVPYTISFYIKCTANSTTPFKWYLTNITGISSDNGWIPISDTSDWVKVSKTITFTVKQNSNNPVIFFRTFDGNKVSITKPKFEKGNQATDWTPAQEDVDQAITSVQTYATTNITSLTSSVSVLQSQIALKVEQTQINTAVATLNGQITATNASITSLQSSINLQLDSITNTVSQAVSIKNLINNAAFNNTLGDYNAQNTVTMCRIVKSSEYTGWGGYVKPPVSDNVLAIRYDMTGDNYIEFKNLFAKVKPSTTYTISYYYTMNGEYAGPSSFIYERTAAQWNVVGYTTATIIGPDAITARSTWVRYTKTFTTQSTTDSIMLRFGFHQTHSSSFCEMLITGVQLELGSSATAWVDSTISQVGTSIIQSTTEVMTAFNGISSYFKVNADGATFGDVASGDYTTVGSGGMKHHIGSTNSDYKYITYVGEVSITINGSTYKDVTISYPADLVALLNGKVPVGIASIKIATWSDVPVHYIGCTITNITSTSCTIRGYNVSTSSSVIISYILVA